MMNARCFFAVGSLALLALACDGQQYVAPDTVALVIKKDSTGVERVNHCHYVPVLLGSTVEEEYLVEGQLRATIHITRDLVSVTLNEAGSPVTELVVEALRFEGQALETAPSPPSGYTVQLSSPCTPPVR